MNAKLALMSVLFGALAIAQEEPREWLGGAPFAQWTRVAGDLGGLRTQLAETGIETSGGYTLDLAAPWSGNVTRRATHASLLDFNVAFDLDVLAGLPKTFAFIDAYSIQGGNPSNDIGDFQGVSNIASVDVDQVAEAWVETWVADLRIKVGKVDFNSEFSVAEIAGEFVNNTAALSPTIFVYPTYPNPATSVNVFYHPTETFYVGAAVYDGSGGEGVSTGKLGPSNFFSGDPSDAMFYAAEVGNAWVGGGGWGAGRVSLGAWHNTGKFAKFSGGTEEGTEGLWAGFEQRVWRENPTEADDQGIGVFCNVGFSDQDVSGCGSSVAAGLQWIGLFPGRDSDVFGLGVFHCDLTDDPVAGTPNDETVFEALYKVQLTNAISVKPEVQYIHNPGGVAGMDDTLVALLRFEFLF